MTDQPSSSEVQRDVQESRERVDRTLNEIEERYSPGRLVDRAMGYMKDNSQEIGMFGRNLGRTMRDHPVPVMLVMGGLAALAVSGMRGEAPPRRGYYGRYENWPGDEDRAAYGGYAYDEDDYDYVDGIYAADTGDVAGDESSDHEGMGEKLKHKTENVVGRAKSAGRRARDRARWARYSVADRYSEASQRVTYGYDRQPLLFGAAASVLGLSLAVMLPATRTEDELLGKVRDQAKEKVQEGVEQARNVARETMSGDDNAASHRAPDL